MTRASIALCALVVFAGCGGTETGNPGATTASVRLAVVSSDPAVATVEMPGGGMVVSELWLSIALADLVPCPGDVRSTESRDPAPADALDGSFVFDVAPGDACGVELNVANAAAPPADAPPELTGRALVVVGARADGTRVIVAAPGPLTLSAVTTVAFPAAEGADFIAALDVAAWLVGLDLASVAPDASGRVLVTETTHPALVSQLQTSASAGVSLYADADGDGAIDSGAHALAGHDVLPPP